MNVGIASIMHSGTHLMVDMLQRCMKGCSIQDAQNGKPGFFLMHLVDAHQNDMRLGLPLITPMRHPVRVLESFRRRSKTLAEMESQYRNLARISPIFIHVDRKDRDAYVERAGKLLNLPLKTDWPLLSPKNTLGWKVTPERIKEIPEFIMDIYDNSL